MRNTHRDMPMHHIEHWTGSFFRAACLWEVGNYILVPHYSSSGRLCRELEFQKTSLEEYQQEKDQAEQALLSHAASGSASAASNAAHEWADMSTVGTAEDEGESEAMSVDELDEDFDEDIRVSAGYLELRSSARDDHPQPNNPPQTSADKLQMPQYTQESEPGNPQNHRQSAAPMVVPQGAADGTDHPGRDSLNNAYVRVIHLNGVHHLALVNCTCLSADEIHANLLSCNWYQQHSPVIAPFSRQGSWMISAFQIWSARCRHINITINSGGLPVRRHRPPCRLFIMNY